MFRKVDRVSFYAVFQRKFVSFSRLVLNFDTLSGMFLLCLYCCLPMNLHIMSLGFTDHLYESAVCYAIPSMSLSLYCGIPETSSGDMIPAVLRASWNILRSFSSIARYPSISPSISSRSSSSLPRTCRSRFYVSPGGHMGPILNVLSLFSPYVIYYSPLPYASDTALLSCRCVSKTYVIDVTFFSYSLSYIRYFIQLCIIYMKGVSCFFQGSPADRQGKIFIGTAVSLLHCFLLPPWRMFSS